MQRLDGISPKTLAYVLKDLRKENLIHRESFSEIPPRVEYSLTEDWKQLCEAVLPLIPWQYCATCKMMLRIKKFILNIV
jgi:DNA-binding HxlR family transcriptional regulator